MQFAEHSLPNTIDAYQSGRITIAGEEYTQNLIIGDGVQLCPDMPPADRMQPETFQAALAAGAEIILIGSGDKQIFAPPQTLAALSAHGVGLESMGTAAACRTFSLLQSEGRKVWAWLHV